MKFKVFIPTSGIGSRLKYKTKNFNKSLIEVNNKPIISSIIEKFHKKQKFVISLGYLGNQVKEYLNLIYPKHNFEFVKIAKYRGKNSGLGLSMIKCKAKLQCPFIFISCDSFIKDKKILEPTHNWLGFSKNRDKMQNYRTFEINNNKIAKIFEKKKINSKKNFKYVGIAGVKDYKIFWSNMKLNKKCIKEGEAYAIKKMLKSKNFSPKKIDWNDAGNFLDLVRLQENENDGQYNILPKENEKLWFVNNNVIKYSVDNSFIAKRVKRQKILKRFTPKIVNYSKNFYYYKKIEGDIFSRNVSQKKFKILLKYLTNFWKLKKLNYVERKKFEKICGEFYLKKTKQRLSLFYKKFNIVDKKIKINNETVTKLSKIFDELDKTKLKKGLPGNFHGDLHFENIIVNKLGKITFLDWRQDFGGLMNYGDVYYDLAKIYHGLIVPHESVIKNNFKIKINNKSVTYSIKRKKIYKSLVREFDNWLLKNGYDLKKVRILCSLVFLNIAALHHDPYSKFLYFLGKDLIYKTLYAKN